jgi:hypothetical protein
MILQSCENCWFNGLQYGAIGLSVGYCTIHKVILNFSAHTTCKNHMRKDLALQRALEVSEHHSNYYPSDGIVTIFDEHIDRHDISKASADLSRLREDSIGELVVDYGYFGSKIESLSQLRRVKGARAEVAMLSLSRAYVNNCYKKNKNKWTSGIHLYWWTKSRLSDIPSIRVEDIRSTEGLQLSRQVELITWSIVMMRLTFIEDIAVYANYFNNDLGKAVGILDEAASINQSFNVHKLSRWMKKEAVPLLDSYLSADQYFEISNSVHVD